MDIDILKVSERLKLDEVDIKKAFERKIISFDMYHNKKYLLFKKKLRHIERGTVLFLNNNMDIVMGYPKIRRAMMLYPTLKNYFINKIVVEEKLDGYNVRITKIDNKVMAITRGGRICPFTTKKALKFLNVNILDDYPNLMLCGEMIGLNNPYVPHYYPEVNNILIKSDKNNNKKTKIIENLGFYIFDVRYRETNKPLSISEKEELLQKYELPYVKPIGIFNKEDIEHIKKIILTLNDKKREGVVLKDPDMIINPIKYTTHYTQCNDLSVAFRYMYDLGIDFMFSRLVREGYQSFEFNEDEKEMEKRAKNIGKSILYPMVNSIKNISKGELITEDFEIYLDSEEDLNEFLDYLKKLHIAFVVKENQKFENGMHKVKIGRIYNSTNDKIKSHLDGNLW
ncbi:RNA ligase [Methanothermococcus okinawensis]|uniref:Y414 protein n=1 Tax=Methanothermococcus okinawensis (strain DSM 14208 / JCM 11175 / IH1) TaxID=647113 RepID=F8ALF3_METOI|nr:RNA ligase [Methanothermococcus okinawensis]AEH06542.1 Y414 protein [Methanothermococcus okinawensis IH1]